jgi:hypothetical protein
MRRLKLVPFSTFLGIVWLLQVACRSQQISVPPSIEFTHLPPAGAGSGETIHTIAGRVAGAQPGQRVVLFARSGVWWVQPVAERPFTTIRKDLTWTNSTHPGSAYAAMLVDAGYKPPLTINALPERGGVVRAVAVAEGSMLDQSSLKKLAFSGYDWTVRDTPGSPGGSRNTYAAANAWVDSRGFMHLRIAADQAGSTSAEVDLSRSLGYGSYRFVVSDTSSFEPPVVLSISTWDDANAYQEMNIEISRWGEPAGKNAQYVVQPYYIPANVVRFLSPAGRLTYSFDWEPGRVAFRTVRGFGSGGKSDVVASHVFTSGVPSAGSETVRLNLYVFHNRRVSLEHGAEVTIEKFEYLP